MKIGILGSGRVGKNLGNKLVEVGYEVMLASRDPGKLKDWQLQAGENAHTGSLAETAAFGEILFSALPGSAVLNALSEAGEGSLSGKILIDVSNSLNRSEGAPTTMLVTNTDSLAEQIQRTYPQTKVVKTLNTVGAAVMTNPRQLADGDHDLFISGNDADAKAQVIQLLTQGFGWRRVFDLGDITTARGAEMYMMLWIRLLTALGTPLFNIKLVR